LRRRWMERLAFGLAVVVMLPAAVLATNGYFSHGVGMKAKGMGGAAVALPQDALAVGTNPAGAAYIGNRFDVGVDWFRPDRGSEITGNLFPGADGAYDANGKQDFFVPEAGGNFMLNENLALGLAVFGRGGMNTTYTTPVPLFGTTDAGVDLSQLFIVPAIALKLNDNHAIGLGVDIAWQRFKATGLEFFANSMFSSDSSAVTNNDYASSYGVGVRLGWIGRLSPMLTAAVSYESRTFMSEFDEYAGLFAEHGDFDIPSSINAGIALRPCEKTVIALDVSHIRYSEIKAIANPLLPNLGQARLGDDNGAGFGWKDVTVFKVGVAHDLNGSLTVRGGYNYGRQPIPESQTLFNILAPGVVEHHLTLGATLEIAPGAEVTAAYMHAFEKTVDGNGSIIPGMPDQGGMGGGEADLRMFENSFGIAFGKRF
jgi:long-chain fatty acid transport protein